ncbi:MAG TPA: hypothetical protein VI643_01740 [Planctomycetota bacterium]|nr:hypothetical protein [Planctomycetota bacterium]
MLRDPPRIWLWVLALALGAGAPTALSAGSFEGRPTLLTILSYLNLGIEALLAAACLTLALRPVKGRRRGRVLFAGGGAALIVGHLSGLVAVGQVALERPIEIGAMLFAATLAASVGSMAGVVAWASAIARSDESDNPTAAGLGAAASVLLVIGILLPVGIHSLLYIRSGYQPLGPIANAPGNVLTLHVAWESAFHWLPAALWLLMGFSLIRARVEDPCAPGQMRKAVSLGAWAIGVQLAAALLQPSYFWFFVYLWSGEPPYNYWDRFLPRLGIEPGNTAVFLAATFGLSELFRKGVRRAT